jgi:hypothetical protein
MHLEAVTVCIDYADILKETIVANKGQFDKWVVVTSPGDKETQQLCKYHHVQCIVYDGFYDGDGKINKARGINAGLNHLTKKGWVLHIDADIVLPTHTRGILEKLYLEGDCVYGCDRLMVQSYEEWAEFQYKPKPVHENYIFTHLTAFPVGVRVNQYMGEGYNVIGFFQLWNPSQSGVQTYPEHISGFDRTDVLFQKLFKPGKRRFMPEIVTIHLDSEQADMGANWKGRKTKLFMPDPAADSKRTVSVKNGYRVSFWQELSIWLKNNRDNIIVVSILIVAIALALIL